MAAVGRRRNPNRRRPLWWHDAAASVPALEFRPEFMEISLAPAVVDGAVRVGREYGSWGSATQVRDAHMETYSPVSPH